MAGENYYSFTSFIRKGYANSVAGVSDLSEKKAVSAVMMRASLQAQISLKLDSGTEILPANTVHLYGPGDVSGIDSRSIIRTDPPEGITNFEPNYLAAIEFYDEDLPWRFSPTSQNNSTGTSSTNPLLTPWLALVALEEKEFTLIPVSADSDSGLLPSFQLTDLAERNSIFCAPENLHAWAHVHTNKDLITKANANGTAPEGSVLNNLKTALDDSGDFCYSRILCPRRLKTKTSYIAFLIPVFETGRLAGIGMYDQAVGTPVNQYSWGQDQTVFPFYYSWRFATGNAGDFEYLVRQLKPKAADERTGYREIVAEGIKDGNDFKTLHMPGALRAPQDTLTSDLKQKISDYENWEAPQNPHTWQSSMASKLTVQLDEDKEPVITMPIYGQWYAASDELLYKKNSAEPLPASTRNNWIHEVNLDPRYRTAAAMGTKVIQKYQEEFMDAAWQQLDELKLVNEKISRLQLAVELNNIIIKNSIKRFQQEQLLGFGNLLSKKIKSGNGKTLFTDVNQSPVPNAIVSNLFKKVSRNTWRIQKVSKNSKQVFSTPLISGLNQQKLQISSLNVKTLNLTLSSGIDQAIQSSMAADTKFKALKPAEQIAVKQKLNIALGMNKDFTDTLKVSPATFKLQAPKSLFAAKSLQLSAIKTTAAKDFSLFKNAVLNKNISLQMPDAFPAEKSISLILNQTSNTLLKAIEALPRLKSRLDKMYPLSKEYWSKYSEQFYPVMDYPEFKLPMYLPLKELAEENFVPNLKLLQQNSVTLLETNQRFIEAYMLGLNHEFSRELLWRGFPTDQKGSYFRYFWDSISDTPDIEEIHRWNKTLGNNGNTSNQGLLVLTLRGDLLRKYPNTVIYAQKAAWDENVKKDRILDSGSEPVFPVFEAKVDPDIYMIGFSLNETDLLGKENPTATTDDPGWFFVLQERPGEPRFGLDEQNTGSLKKWSDLSWNKLGTLNGQIINLRNSLTIAKSGDDIQASWPPKDSAQTAYIFYQQPVMVSIHASRLLK